MLGNRMVGRLWAWVGAVVVLAAAGGVGTPARAQTLVLASTTSTEQSGLFAFLLPQFTQATGIAVKVVAVGTGQAIDMGRRGDADALLVHDTAAEEKLVADGVAQVRYPVMYNDFVLVGPASDPAGARGNDIEAALARIAAHNADFISRGDHSGTHAAELRFWQWLHADRAARGSAYRECGCGMGQALNMASNLGAYVLTDRGTWLAFRNRGELTVLVEGDQRLFNQYGVLLLNPQRYPDRDHAAARKWADWLTTAPGQNAIAAYRINGQQLFFPNAAR